MKAIFDNKLSDRNKFKDICTGDCFDYHGEIFIKGIFGSTMKPKALNLITGEIIDIDSNTEVIPVIAEMHYKR